MQLYARPVDWDKVVDVVQAGRLGEVMQSDEASTLYLAGYNWNNNSSVHYMHAAEALVAIARHLPDDMQTASDALAQLINEEMAFPRDLGKTAGQERIAGALDPERVNEILEALVDINYETIETAFDQYLPAKLKVSLSRGFDRKAMSAYVRLWHDLLGFAQERQAGVLIELRPVALTDEG